jgi:hypothetical protein
MRFLDSLDSIAVALGRIADAVNFLALEGSVAPDPTGYEVTSEPGVYNPTEEDMVGYLQQYGEFHADAVADPYRGWDVFDDEDKD